MQLQLQLLFAVDTRVYEFHFNNEMNGEQKEITFEFFNRGWGEVDGKIKPENQKFEYNNNKHLIVLFLFNKQSNNNNHHQGRYDNNDDDDK